MIQANARRSLLAHQTQISEDVGGTYHIEPNDTPRAGEPSTAWFALVQSGGGPVPLSDCDCGVAVYGSPYRSGDPAIATPPLRAIEVEGQANVPAAEVVFPKIGAYELVIRGAPKGTATFSPFELRFPITVAEMQTPPKTAVSRPEKTSSSPNASVAKDALPVANVWPVLGMVGLGAIALLALIVILRKR